MSQETNQLKFGADYRDIFLDVNGPQNVISFSTPTVEGLIPSGVGSLYAARELPADILTQVVFAVRAGYLEDYSAIYADVWPSVGN